MNTYKIEFYGRENGAIGICYKIIKRIQSENEKTAVLKLYETHEHISVESLEEVAA